VQPEQKEANYLDYQDSTFLIRPLWLAKVSGTRQMAALMIEAEKQGLSVDQTVTFLESQWRPGIDRYLKLRDKYRLYP